MKPVQTGIIIPIEKTGLNKQLGNDSKYRTNLKLFMSYHE